MYSIKLHLMVTDLADPIHERILIEDVHRSRLEQGTCSLDSDIGSLHFGACLLNHLNPLSDITSKGYKSPVKWRVTGIHSGIE